MIFDILTLFPEMFRSPLEHSIVGRAVHAGLIEVNLINIRDYAVGKHLITDDYPYGGGRGMIMKAEPIIRAVRAITQRDPAGHVVLLTPQGAPLEQERANQLAERSRLILVCGRYEGIDERIRDVVDEELSIGDYVLTGGELAALVVVDVVARLIPDVLGNDGASADDTFSHGLLEFPQYTRPREFEGKKVPHVLLSGDHRAIDRWRRYEALRRTLERRPDLLPKAPLSEEDVQILGELEKSSRGE